MAGIEGVGGMGGLLRVWLGILLLGVCIPLSAAFAAQDEEPTPAAPETTVHVVTYIEVKTNAVPHAIGMLLQYRNAGRDEAGNAVFDLHQEVGRPYRFAVYEQWQSQAALTAHEQGAAATRLLSGLAEIQSALPNRRILAGFAVGPVRPQGGGRAQVYGISRFEIPLAQIAAFRATMASFLEASRNEPGGMRFDILEEEDSQSGLQLVGLTLVESWNNPGNFEDHRSSNQFVQFREALAPLVVGLYQDRLYGGFD